MSYLPWRYARIEAILDGCLATRSLEHEAGNRVDFMLNTIGQLRLEVITKFLNFSYFSPTYLLTAGNRDAG